MERHYAGLGKPAVAAVLGESDERSFLQDLGWVPESHDADTLFQLASVASVRRALRSVDHSGVMLTVDGATATAAVPGLAQGLAAYADDWVGFRGIEVDPDHRRRGLAARSWPRCSRGGPSAAPPRPTSRCSATTSPPWRCTSSMGFTTHHAYAYLTPPLDQLVSNRG